jgi:hypothetical protein
MRKRGGRFTMVAGLVMLAGAVAVAGCAGTSAATTHSSILTLRVAFEGARSITLRYSPVMGADSYVLERSPDGEQPFSVL